MALKVGEWNLRVMGTAGRRPIPVPYGHPAPTAVAVTPINGKAILVSGHDLKDLEEPPQTDRREKHQRSTRTAKCCGAQLSGFEEISPSGGQLRQRLAETARRIQPVSRRDSDDHQLHSGAAPTVIKGASLPAASSPGRELRTSPTATSPR